MTVDDTKVNLTLGMNVTVEVADRQAPRY